MTLLWTRLCWIVVVLVVWTPQAQCRNVTHEDIRDAMLSLVHMFRTSEDKLERHEYREKALGEQLKKSLSGLEKRHRALEPLKGMISRLDERLSNVETILFQKEEREKATQKKTNEALEGIQKTLQQITAGLNLGSSSDSAGDAKKPSNSLDSKLDAVKQDIEGLKSSLSKESLRAVCLEMVSEAGPYSDAEKQLTRYDTRVNGSTNGRVPTDFVPLSEVSLADEAWHSKMTEVMERQEQQIRQINQVLTESQGIWKSLPRAIDVAAAANDTLAAVQALRHDLNATSEDSVSRVVSKLRELSDRLTATNEDIQRSLTQGNTMSERAYGEISTSYDTLKTEVAALSKSEHVMIQTADNVIANRKRIEYGVHQILVEVGELVKAQGKTLNKTINDRFDAIETTVEENQNGALSNLSSKIETEMSAVWRQIGVMYQQLTASKMSLDKLTEQTEQYVNGSANTMNSMKDKVGMITTRMTEVDDNLNYLLGRLSLVTQEFRQVKTGLGDALDKVKESFSTVQAKIQDAGPGPHNITSAEKIS